ncbi:hypothetical protein MPSEU_000778800 [Mayamaea pseudoterrestris]|nr:hypothetical protein MPSEU_000778800 [Mayamaea pseudoterrestris]
MMQYSLVALLALCASASAYDVVSLTEDNYAEMTDGKTVFIKFFAPWCGHCKRMAPDWEKLAEGFDGDKVGLVAEVDCTAEGKSLCDANGIKGFPTLKFGDPNSLEDYQGQRSFKDLEKFAKENLKPVCSPANIDLCESDKKKQINDYLKLDDATLDSKIKEEETKLTKAEEEFKAAVEKLQSDYQKLSEDKDKKLAEVKEAGLGLLKSVKAFKGKSASGKADEL